MTRWLILLLVVGCGGKKQQPESQPVTAVDGGVAVAKRAETEEPEAKPPSKEALAKYRKHLARGRKLAQKKQYGEAVVEFERALEALPSDGRALSELGWAAFNAGDYRKARRANAESVRQALDKKLKAASLYNLGRVEEATGDTQAAAKLYRQSLELRPSKIVEERLAGLGQEAPAAAEDPLEELPCAQPVAKAELCGCLKGQADEVDLEAGAGFQCELDEQALAAAGLILVKASFYPSTESMLVAAAVPGGYAVVARLADVYNPGAFGIFEEFEVESAATETVGGKTLAKLVTHHSRADTDMGIYEVESAEVRTLTVCLLGDDRRATTCPLAVPLLYRYSRERMEALDDGELSDEERAHLKEYGTPGLPIDERAEVKVEIRPDGTASVILVKGTAPAWIGDKKIW